MPPRFLKARRFDAIGAALLLAIAALAACAGWAALHFGWFRSPWELVGLVIVCAAFLAVGLPTQSAAPSSVAKSRWATRLDLHSYGVAERPLPESVDQGVYLGTFEDRDPRGAVPLRYKGERHLICFGQTGSGKSMSIVVPNIQNLPRSMIIVDPKGDVTAITARRRKAIGDKVIVLNPFGLFTKKRPFMKSAGWNPLLQLDPASPKFASHAMCIADAIVEKASGDAGGNSKFFETSAQNLVQALLMWERIDHSDEPSLRNITRLLTAPDTYDADKKLTGGFTFELQRMARCDNAVVRETASGLLIRLNDTNSQSTSIRDIIETLKSHFAFMRDDRIAFDMARGGAIDFGALHRRITTIYLILPTGELADQSKWLRMFINLALRNLYESAPSHDKPPTLPPVLLLLDEFGNLGRMQEVVKALNMVRSARVQLMFFLQNIGQLTGSYKGEIGSFFSGAGAAITFKTGALDTETTEHLAKAFGNQEMRIQTETQGGGSVRPEAIPLIRAEDISRLEAGTTIALIEPCPWPIKAQMPVYAATGFKEGLDPNPTYFG